MNRKQLFIAGLLVFSILTLPVLAEDNESSHGVLKKGSSDKFLNSLDSDTKDSVDTLGGALAWAFKIGATAGIIISAIGIFLSRKKQNAHEESEGMEKLVKIGIVIIAASILLGWVNSFKY